MGGIQESGKACMFLMEQVLMEMQFVKVQNAERREDTFGAKNGTKETKKNSVWHTLSLSTNIHVEMSRKGKKCGLEFR